MYSYENRFEVLEHYLHEPRPTPSRIYYIMQALEISQRIAMEICYNTSRSKFRSYLKPELEEPGFETPHIRLMPAHIWRYFKLNCCIYADRYQEPTVYTKYSATRMHKPLSHICLDMVRYLNNWYSASYFLANESGKSKQDYKGLYIDKSQLNKNHFNDDDIHFLLSKADHLAGIYGYSCAEDFFKAKLLSPAKTKVCVLPLAG